MSTIPPHIAGQYLRALVKRRRAGANSYRTIAGPRAASKWLRRYRYWRLRMRVILPYLEDGEKWPQPASAWGFGPVPVISGMTRYLPASARRR